MLFTLYASTSFEPYSSTPVSCYKTIYGSLLGHSLADELEQLSPFLKLIHLRSLIVISSTWILECFNIINGLEQFPFETDVQSRKILRFFYAILSESPGGNEEWGRGTVQTSDT